MPPLAAFLPLRKIKKWGGPALVLTIILIVFVDFDFQHRRSWRKTPPAKRTRRIVEQWTAEEEETVLPSYWKRNRAAWKDPANMPQTRVVRHVPGWTLLDNVYLYKGTFYLVASNASSIPDRRLMISSGKEIRDEPGDEIRREPTDHNMRIIKPSQVERIFGSHAKRMEGTTFVVYDTTQYFSNIYHFLSETFFGLWRTYSSLDAKIEPDGTTTLTAPQRLILPNMIDFHWRDKDGLSAQVLYGAFPSLGIQTAEDWQDLSELNTAILFDRVLLSDRSAAMRNEDFPIHHHIGFLANSMAASPHWWVPMRNIFHQLSGSRIDTYTVSTGKPVITYLSRQGYGKRSLKPEDHDELVRELSRLEGVYGYEVHIYRYDDLSFQELVNIAARSTILMGVHSEVLLPLLWMHPTRRSAIIEFYGEDDHNQNYGWNAAALGIQAYAFYETKKHYTYPEYPLFGHRRKAGPIRVDGDYVAALCIHILTEPSL